jgi:ADP-heptose:LPS heptosyltransferase
MEKQKLSSKDSIQIPAVFHPGFRTELAKQNGVAHKLMFKTWGGIGDQLCAEPTLRFAIDHFKECEIYLASEAPELFSHLKFKRVFNLKEETPIWDHYLCFDTITPPDESNMVWLFFSHMLTHCVDFPSMCALRLQLPIEYKPLKLPQKINDVGYNVVIHPGKHWPSKTFPKDWWDSVINQLISKGIVPVIIGANTDDNRGTVDIDNSGCIDLRNKTSLIETISILKNSKVLLTNDSSPLHMAVDSACWIGYVATCKRPDYITHWRKDENGKPSWSWRMENLGIGGIWDIISENPNQNSKVVVDQIEEEILVQWLPDPIKYAEWAISKLD